jgi:hypothetical protein
MADDVNAFAQNTDHQQYENLSVHRRVVLLKVDCFEDRIGAGRESNTRAPAKTCVAPHVGTPDRARHRRGALAASSSAGQIDPSPNAAGRGTKGDSRSAVPVRPT